MPEHVVVDASAVLSLLLDEPTRDDIAERVEKAHMVSSAFLPYELTNVVGREIRKTLVGRINSRRTWSISGP